MVNGITPSFKTLESCTAYFLTGPKYLNNYLGWRRWLERWGPDNSPRVGLYAAMGLEMQFQRLTQT
jgi:hypothetical protein